MKSVLMSIQPKWWKQICNFLGYDNRRPLYKKRLELRKSKPKIETPFKCFVYETKTPLRWNKAHNNILGGEGGYVVGEFICDYILSHCEMANADVAEQMSCVPREEILKYSNGKEVFGWHISDLVIYDKPRELSEFYVVVENEDCGKCKYYDTPCESEPCNQCQGGRKYLTRPPQSWCYIESEVQGE